MAKQTDPSRLPSPPKPTFPVEIMPPSNTGFGGGFGSFGGGGDFRSQFLKFMQEAGEALGRAAAEEISKAKIGIEQGKPLSGLDDNDDRKRKTPAQNFAMQQFLRAANMPDFTKLAGMLSAPMIAAKLLNFAVNAPSAATGQAESQRRFANVSPSMASAFAESGVQDRLRDLKSGETLAPSNRELLRELAKFRDSAAQWSDFITWARNEFYSGVMGGINSLVNPLTEMAFGKRSNPVRLPWENRMIEMADKENHNANIRVWQEMRDRLPAKPAGAKD